MGDMGMGNLNLGRTGVVVKRTLLVFWLVTTLGVHHYDIQQVQKCPSPAPHQVCVDDSALQCPHAGMTIFPVLGGAIAAAAAGAAVGTMTGGKRAVGSPSQ